MATDQKRLPPLRLNRAVDNSGLAHSVPLMPKPVPERPVAPNRLSPTQNTRPIVAPTELSITIDPRDYRARRLLIELIDHITGEQT